MLNKQAEALAFVQLASTPKRADGTYNYCREALEQKANEILALPDAPQSNLAAHAATIQLIFQRLTVLYKDGVDSGDWMDEAGNILALLDADACAEIIEAAKAEVDQQ